MAVSAVVDVLLALARIKPQFIVVEDLHWADSLTRDVVAALATQARQASLLVTITSRDPCPDSISEKPGCTLLSLPRLNQHAVEDLVRSIWASDHPSELPYFIYTKSEGVPLFAEELTHYLKNLPPDTRTPQAWEQALRDGRVATLQDLIAARLEGLGDSRRLAQLASVIGRDFNRNLLAKFTSIEYSTDALKASLRRLVSSGIIVGDKHAYRFGHVLFQQAAYDSLLKAHRRDLHARIVQILTADQPSPYPAEMIAWHYSESGQPFEAAQYAVKAAEACAARFAMEEADRLLSFSDKQFASLTAEPSAVRDLRLAMLAVRGPVAAALHGRGSPQACAIYEEGVTLCQTQTDQDLAKWFPLYWGWWFTAPNSENKVRSDILVRDLKHTADPEVRLQSLHCAWATAFDAGQHSYCLDCVREGLTLYDEERAVWMRGRYGGHDAKVCALGERALSLWFMGHEKAAIASIEEAIDWAKWIDHPASIFHALDYAAGLAYYRGDVSGALLLATQMDSLAAAHGMPSATAKARLFGGWAKAMVAPMNDGVGAFDRALNLQREIGTEENLCIYNDMKTDLLELNGQYEAALNLTAETIESSLATGQTFWVPELLRRKARLLRKLGQTEERWKRDLEAAIDMADSQGAIALSRRARADQSAPLSK